MIRTFNLRPVLFINGVLLTILAAAMMVPAIADALVGNDDWKVFAIGSAVTLFIAVSLGITTREDRAVLSPRQAFFLVAVSWFMVSLFSALPFLFADVGLSFSDAFFEATSGITTTGATVLSGLDTLPPGLLLWRGMLQWLGGVGLIVMAVFLLPELRVGGMQFFRPEGGSYDTFGLRVVSLAARIFGVYAAITVLGMLALLVLGLRPLDAIVHAMTSVATGGFSNYDRSIAHFDSAAIEGILILLMIAGAMPFVQILRALSGQRHALTRDPQIRWMLSILTGSIFVLTLWLVLTRDHGLFSGLRLAAFNTVSMMTGTGYATTAYDRWGALPMLLLVILMVTGGCTGSSCSGLKVFRVQLLLASVRVQLRRLSDPQAVHLVRYAGRPVSDGLILSLMAFFILFLSSIMACAVLLTALGLDILTAISAAVSAVANIGPGYGPVIGPEGNYAPLGNAAKWVMALAMIIGRLELYAVLVMFSPSFWRE